MSGRGYRKSRRAAERVLRILDRISGGRKGRRDGPSPDRDRRRDRRGDPERRFRGPRYLTIRGNEELFGRLCREDFDFLRCQRFSAGAEILDLLLPQSVVGRAQNGHGYFVDAYGESIIFREATFDRVLTELEVGRPEMRGDRVREARSRLVERVRDHVLAHLDSETMPLFDAAGPLLGIDLLAGREVETRAFLRGLVLAGNMDEFDQRNMTLSWRRTAMDGQPLTIGGGEIRVVDRERFLRTGIVDPGQYAWDDDELEHLESLGVLMPDDPGREWAYPDYDQAFFRRRMGYGVCDDLALIHIGATEGLDAMLGGFVMDGIDTYDKYLARFRGRGTDSLLAEEVQQRWRDRFDEPLVGGEQIFDLIWFAAKDNVPPLPLSSSHRRLIQFENRCRVPTLLQHWRFLQGETLEEFKLGFARMPAGEFYEAVHTRLIGIGSGVPPPSFKRSG